MKSALYYAGYKGLTNPDRSICTLISPDNRRIVYLAEGRKIMPKISDLTHQHRQVSGNHTYWLDKKNGTQSQQDKNVKQQAMRPGRHSGNIHRQVCANAAVQLLFLSSVQNNLIRPAISPGRAERLNTEKTLTHADANYLYRTIDRSVRDGIRTAAHVRTWPVKSANAEYPGNSCCDNSSESSALSIPAAGKNSLDPCLVSRLIEVRQAPEVIATDSCENTEAVKTSLWQQTQDYYASVSEIVSQYDPLKFAAADAAHIARPRHAGESRIRARHRDKQRAAGVSETFSSIRNRENIVLTRFLQQKGLLDAERDISGFTKEERVSAVASWLHDRVVQPRRKVKKIAQLLLSASDLYGGRKGERVSRNQAESVIRNWVFGTILGASLSQYLAREIAREFRPAYITVSSIRHLLSLERLHQDRRLNLTKIPAVNWGPFNAMWFTWLRKEIPLLGDLKQDTNGIATNSLAFADLYSGSRYLADTGNLNGINQTEVRLTGEKLWEMAASNGIEAGKMSYFLLPSLLFLARNAPEKLIWGKNIYAISATAINHYIHFREEARAIQQDFNNKFDKYQAAVGEWLNKQALADKIISACPVWDLPSQSPKDASMLYMNGFKKPCRNAPESLDEHYQMLTDNVANHFADIDKYLIWAALAKIQKEDADFLSAPDAIACPFSLTMRTNRVTVPQFGYLYDNNFNVGLDKTDLFSVTAGNEERIYALRGLKEKNNGGYEILRVDRNIVRYIETDILNYKKFGNHYKLAGNKVNVGGETFTFSFFTDRKNTLSQRGNNENLVNYFSKIHRDIFYRSLYEAGNDKTDLQKVWEVVKHMVPFYDCVAGIIDKNPLQTVPACLLDVLAFLPVFGQAARIGGNFGMGLARGIRSGLAASARESIAGASQAVIREITLPGTLELVSLGKNTLRTLDPGFELLGGVGKKFAEKLIYQLSKEEKSAVLAEKLAARELLDPLPSPSDSFISARLPDSDISVPVRKVAKHKGHDIYAMVNPDTGEVAGKRFVLPEHSEHLHYHYPNRPAVAPRQPAAAPQGIADLSRVAPLHHFLPTMNAIRLPHTQMTDVTAAITASVIEAYHSNRVYIHNYAASAEDIPDEFTWLKDNLAQLNAEIIRAVAIVSHIKNELRTHYLFTDNGMLIAVNRNNYIEKYFRQALNTQSPAITAQAINRFSHYIDQIGEYLAAPQSILFATARREGRVYNPSGGGANGFNYHNDCYKRITLLVDKFEGQQMFNNDLAVTVLHEASHAAGSTADFFISAHTSRVGEASDIVDSLDEILSGVDREATLQVNQEFLFAYTQQLGIATPTMAQFMELIRRDPMLKANIIMDNADTLANMINDIAKESAALHRERHRREEPEKLNIVQKTLFGLIASNLIGVQPLQLR